MKLRKSSCTFFAATALALAGCGESDTTTTYTNPVPDLLITIGQQERKASGAKGSADMTLKDATTKAMMLSAVKVKGESSDAEANAQAILAAKAKVDSALTEATAALTALQEAKTEADALPADTPKLEELKAELATAITDATRHRDAIKAIRDAKGNDSLAKLVEKVTGTGDKKMTPADIAAAVAVEVERAMVFKSGTSASPTREYPPITGGPTLTSGSNYTLWSMVSGLSPAVLGTDYGTTSIQELPGVRMESTDYANYGYWLGIPKNGGSILSSSVFGIPKNEDSARNAPLAANSSFGDDNTASYSGKALGISVLTARDGRNRKAIKSGEFTADVKLTATFAGTDSTVKGTIDNFKGDAVGDDWSVDLKTAKLVTATPTSDWGIAKGSGSRVEGSWYARAAKGPDDARPPGISGIFVTLFGDGRAVGGYAVVKDE